MAITIRVDNRRTMDDIARPIARRFWKDLLMADALPVACRLSDADLGRRRAELTDDLFGRVASVRALDDGYAFGFAGNPDWPRLLGAFIAEERICCPFLDFSLRVLPGDDLVWLELRGPDMVQSFIRDTFVPEQLPAAGITP